MAGGFAPIGDVYKCDVFKMCIAKNLQERRMFENNEDVIPQNVISRAPSAELTENQTDEESLGVDYATLDAILREHVDSNKKHTTKYCISNNSMLIYFRNIHDFSFCQALL